MAFKAFIKLFETPQRSARIKIYLKFFSSSGIGTGRVKTIEAIKVTQMFLKKRFSENGVLRGSQ